MQGSQRDPSTGDAAFHRAHTRRSGWHVAIYRRRLTEDFTDYSTAPVGGSDHKNVVTGLQKLEISDEFYFLAEMRIDPNNEGVFTDDGTILPDYNRPLRSTGTHLGMELYPAPDARYPVRVSYSATPTELKDDTDVPPVMGNAYEALVEGSLSLLQRMLGDPAWREARARYMEEVDKIAKEMGSPVPEAQVMRKRAARRGRTRRSIRTRLGRTEV
jgi:hypothetical protein